MIPIEGSVRAAQTAVDGYEAEQPYFDKNELLADLLCDLMHWATVHKLDFEEAHRLAKRNHYHEHYVSKGRRHG